MSKVEFVGYHVLNAHHVADDYEKVEFFCNTEYEIHELDLKDYVNHKLVLTKDVVNGLYMLEIKQEGYEQMYMLKGVEEYDDLKEQIGDVLTET